MITTISGLSDEELQSFEPCGHWPVAWIVQHCCGNVDSFTYKHITGKAFLEHDMQRIGWPFKVEPKPGDAWPAAAVLAKRWSSSITRMAT